MRTQPTVDIQREPEALKAVVLYTDEASGSEAQGLLARVAHRSGAGEAWSTNLWRFDVMAEQPIAACALADAKDAQLIFLSARSIGEPPAWLMEWLHAWASQRTVKSAAVAAWCRHVDSPGTLRGLDCLRNFARERGLTFLCAEEHRGLNAA